MSFSSVFGCPVIKSNAAIAMVDDLMSPDCLSNNPSLKLIGVSLDKYK